VKKIITYIVLILIVALIGVLAYVKLALPNVGSAPDLKVELTPERIERGRYLANTVCVCMDCHSTRDWSLFSGPLVENTLGKGGEKFDESLGFPGTYYSRNITPAALKDWTDGEIYRAIVSGVSKDGHAMFPVMPYPYYSKLDKDDIISIIAYIRTLKPIDNEIVDAKSNFPMNFIINTIPAKPNHQPKPAKTDVVNYGKYIASAAACVECHSPVEKGQIIAGKEYSGGREFLMPNGNILRTPNITNDLNTGMGAWTEDQFVQLFKTRSDSTAMHQKVGPNDFNSIMPWTMYGKMETEDLKAIFAYLKTIKGVKNEVVKFTPKH
jgi:hypothetical protein